MLMKKFFLVVAISLSFFMTGCDPTIDFTSTDTIQQSGVEIKETLDAEQKVFYDEAISYFSDKAYSELGSPSMSDELSTAKVTKQVIELMEKELGGKNGADIISSYTSSLSKDKANIQSELESLQETMNKLSEFKVEDTGLYTADDFMNTPQFSFKALNETGTDVGGMTFYLRVTDNGTGNVIKDDFVEFSFSDPLKKGRNAEFSKGLGFVQWKSFFRVTDMSKVSYQAYLVKLVNAEGQIVAEAMQHPALKNRLEYIQRRI